MTSKRDQDTVEEMLDQWRAQRPDLDSDGMGVVLRILRISAVMSERLKSVLAPFGLAPWEYDVLSALLRTGKGEGMSSKELCKAAQITSGSMTHRLDRLEERRLVRRRARSSDGRGITVTLTSRGRALVGRIVGDRMAEATESLRSLKKKERRDLTRLLRTVSKGLEGS